MIRQKVLSVWSVRTALGFVLMGFGCRAPEPQRPHTITVTLNYDFTKRHACAAAETENCIKQFKVYELISGQPLKLFSFAAPAGSRGPVKGITGTSGLLKLSQGDHIIGATAVMADGSESDPKACTVIAKVPSASH